MRARGLTWSRLPLFIWSHYATSIIILLGTPVLAITMVLVGAERIFGLGIFDPARGGDPVLFQVLFPPGGLHHDPPRHGGDQRAGPLLPPPTMSATATRRPYLLVFAALMGLLVLTVAVSYIPYGRLAWLGILIALTIAAVKAVLVALYFMNLKGSPRLIRTSVVSGILWLLGVIDPLPPDPGGLPDPGVAPGVEGVGGAEGEGAVNKARFGQGFSQKHTRPGLRGASAGANRTSPRYR
jgi:caa(3)-type oxidase subunit IV